MRAPGAIELILCTLLCLFALANGTTMHAHVPATHGQIKTNFLITANGISKTGLFKYSVRNNIGTFEIRGKKYISVAYYTQGTMPWGTDQARWVDFLGVSEDGTNVAWIVFQCEPIFNPTSIVAVYEEDFFYEGLADPTTAVCDFVDLAGKPDAIIDVNLPPVTAAPVAGRVDSNVTIIGKEVYLHRKGPGWIILDKEKYITVPITNIPCPDCGSDCAECMTSPWYETHVVFYNKDVTKLGFGILYMYPYNRTIVQFNYTLILPTLDRPAVTFPARWYGNPLLPAESTPADPASHQCDVGDNEINSGSHGEHDHSNKNELDHGDVHRCPTTQRRQGKRLRASKVKEMMGGWNIIL